MDEFVALKFNRKLVAHLIKNHWQFIYFFKVRQVDFYINPYIHKCQILKAQNISITR